MPHYGGLKYTDADADARWLAHMLRLGVLPEGYIYPKAERAVRAVWRKRSLFVRQQTANVLSLQNIIVLCWRRAICAAFPRLAMTPRTGRCVQSTNNQQGEAARPRQRQQWQPVS